MFGLIRTVISEKIKITTTKNKQKPKRNDDRQGQTLSDGKKLTWLMSIV